LIAALNFQGFVLGWMFVTFCNVVLIPELNRLNMVSKWRGIFRKQILLLASIAEIPAIGVYAIISCNLKKWNQILSPL
jgi:hypothetical protein